MRYKGLTSAQAKKRLESYGPNILPEKGPPSDFILFLSQLKSPLIYILIFAAAVTFFLKDFSDTLIILLAVFINTILGFYQERKAERALLALKKILSPKARVLRDKKIKIIEAKDLVPGDLVLVSSGDKIPGDAVVLEGTKLFVNEAMLTGESEPINKSPIPNSSALPAGRQFPISNTKPNKQNLVFMGTEVLTGYGKILITKTGKKTEMGKIALSLVEKTEEKTPLQKKLTFLARILALMVAGICFLIFAFGIILAGEPLTMFTTAVAIAVAAIPEGMVVSLTAVLAIGMQRILKRKALARKLLAAETLGSVTVIATDKTGTLTEGLLRVAKTNYTDFKNFFKAAVFANNLVDPLEIALWKWAQQQSSKMADPQKMVDEIKRVDEIPFDPEKKYQAVLVKEGKSFQLFVSGAPEVILKKCKLKNSQKKLWEEKIKKWGSKGLRMIGLAYADIPKKISLDSLNSDLTWLGLVGFEDPVREGAAEALKFCQQAGIKVKIVTGDYQRTAEAVLKKLKVRFGDDEISVMDGHEVERLSAEALARKVERTILFSRVTPTQKLKIVDALKANGEVVALLGDGVNDAPALKRADIGIVVGEAQDTAKETADMVLLDSNFSTILAAIEEGRGIFANIKKIILYLLSDSFSEVLLILSSLFLHIPLPLTAAQILWINLITDGFPNLALTVEPKEKGLLKRPPTLKDASLLDSEGIVLICLISYVTGMASLLIFLIFLVHTGNLILSRSIVFAALGVDSLLYVFSVRNLKKPIWQTNPFSNPYLIFAVFAGFLLQIISLYLSPLQKLLKTVGLGFLEWGVILVFSVLVIGIIEVVKNFFSQITTRRTG